jgi:hypothetical protein
MKNFSQEAVVVFENNPDVGVVYGDAEYFGDINEIWKVDKFNLNKMLVHNYIDACAIYKKKFWEEVGGYDENMPYQGHEDWDFWISLGILNVKFYHLNKVTFKYYVSKTSMIKSFTLEMVLLNQDYIVKKYSRQYHNHYVKVYLALEKYNKKPLLGTKFFLRQWIKKIVN